MELFEADGWIEEAYQAAAEAFKNRSGRQYETAVESNGGVKHLGPPATIGDPGSLRECRWGVILPDAPTGAEKAQLDALAPLMKLRAEQMGLSPEKMPPVLGYAIGHTAPEFLADRGRDVEPAMMRVDKVPYYLLIVAPPDRISWDFQADLDAEYAVGRLWFDDLEDCRSYVAKRVAYERATQVAGNTDVSHRTVFWAPKNPQDSATTKSTDGFVRPLYQWLQTGGHSPTGFVGETATRSHLLTWLRQRRAAEAPTLLFTASHGAEYPLDAFDGARLGALVSGEWGGPGAGLIPDHLVTAADVAALPDADFSGTITYLFACFSAGAPREREWIPPVILGEPAPPVRPQIAPSAQIAQLPQKLLAKGMGAVIGHVDRAFTYSFMGRNLWRPQLSNFEALIAQLLRGVPVGHATDDLNKRALSETASMGTLLLSMMQTGSSPADKRRFVESWVSRMDARYHMILGDPAARLPAVRTG